MPMADTQYDHTSEDSMKNIYHLEAILSVGVLICLLAIISIQGQSKQTNHDIQFYITGRTKICLDDTLTLKATVKNTGTRPIKVHKALWRYMTEKALDQNSAKVTGSNLRLKAPVMRGTIAEHVGVDAFIVLLPGEQFSTERVIDLKSDAFYREPGRYSVELLLPLARPKDTDIFSKGFVFRVTCCIEK